MVDLSSSVLADTGERPEFHKFQLVDTRNMGSGFIDKVITTRAETGHSVIGPVNSRAADCLSDFMTILPPHSSGRSISTIK